MAVIEQPPYPSDAEDCPNFLIIEIVAEILQPVLDQYLPDANVRVRSGV